MEQPAQIHLYDLQKDAAPIFLPQVGSLEEGPTSAHTVPSTGIRALINPTFVTCVITSTEYNLLNIDRVQQPSPRHCSIAEHSIQGALYEKEGI